jgi:hypothetical protein
MPDRIERDKEIDFRTAKKGKKQLKPPKSPERVDENGKMKEEEQSNKK